MVGCSESIVVWGALTARTPEPETPFKKVVCYTFYHSREGSLLLKCFPGAVEINVRDGLARNFPMKSSRSGSPNLVTHKESDHPYTLK